MKIIKISAIGSTNDYLKKLSKSSTLEDETMVQTLHQTHGKGQMGASWQFEIGKSLAFSIFKNAKGLPITHQYLVNFAVSLGVKNGLETLGIPKVSIKWPNDILADGKKVCGILVENQFKNTETINSIIGIGINVNNTGFSKYPQAGSLRLSTGILYAMDEVFETVTQAILFELRRIHKANFENYKYRYESCLFRKGMISTFEDLERKKFNGIIEGVSNNGMLRVKLNDDNVIEFRLKDIKLLY